MIETILSEELQELLAARDPIVFLHTDEEDRGIQAARQSLAPFMADIEAGTHLWSTTEGVDGTGMFRKAIGKDGILTAIREDAFKSEAAQKAVRVWTLLDFHPALKDPNVRRTLKDLQRDLKATRTSVVMLVPTVELPDGLDRIFNVVRLALPDRPEMEMLIRFVTAEETATPKMLKNAALFNEHAADLAVPEAIVSALMGMPDFQARLAVRRSIALCDELDVETLLACKASNIKRGGILELVQPGFGFEAVAGYDICTTYLNQRQASFSTKGYKFIGSYPRGVTFVGISGCGKSHTAKALAAQWKLPLMRLDLGKVFGSLVGQSEAQMRAALEQADAMAPGILWVDEIEKGLAGMSGGSGGDNGVGSRVFGTFITWLQDRTAPLYVVFTANDISMLPPETMRKGRIDEVFFFDLPTFTERLAIFQVHLDRKRDIGAAINAPGDYDLDALAETAEGFVGAEIEGVIIDGLYRALDLNPDEGLTQENIISAIEDTVPLSKTKKDVVDGLREWALEGARFASSESAAATGKKVKASDKFIDMSGSALGQMASAGVLSLGKKNPKGGKALKD